MFSHHKVPEGSSTKPEGQHEAELPPALQDMPGYEDT